MASDPELKRLRLRWSDARAILTRRDELNDDDDPPLEALRIWASLRDLRQSTEWEAEARVRGKEDRVAYRWERRRRDDFNALVKEIASRGKLKPESTWEDARVFLEGDPRYTALTDSPGATRMELFDEVMEELRQAGPESFIAKEPAKSGDGAERPRKRTRFDPEPEIPPPTMEMPPDDMNALDELINTIPPQDPAAAPAVPVPAATAEPTPAPAPTPGAAAAPADEEEDAGAAALALAAAASPAPASKQAAVEPRPSKEELLGKKVDDLKAMCKARGLPVSGRKQELVDRLVVA